VEAVGHRLSAISLQSSDEGAEHPFDLLNIEMKSVVRGGAEEFQTAPKS
jgi:hypothetical protein